MRKLNPPKQAVNPPGDSQPELDANALAVFNQIQRDIKESAAEELRFGHIFRQPELDANALAVLKQRLLDIKESAAEELLMKPFLLSLSDPRNKAWFRFLEILREAKNDPEIATNPVTVGVIEILEVLVEEAHEHSTADDFWKLVKKAVRTEHARAIATKKNAGLRQWVLAEWSQRVDHGQSKESFARSILPLLKKQFPQNQALKTLKATTIAHDWLPATKK